MQKTLFSILVLLVCISHPSKATSFIYNVTDYGVKANSGRSETASLQKIIDLCSTNGGGTVCIPTGTYISGTLFLKNNVMLFLDRGAVLRGSSDLNEYPELRTHRKGLIHAENVHNTGICGSGVIDANGNDTVFHGGAKSPDRIYAANFEGCSQIDIRNVSLINASYWTLRISDCDHVQIRGITIRSTSYFNNDGIDLDGRNIIVSDCIIDCIDDAICLKSYDKERPCENIAISNCIVSSNCNAIKLGTASRGGFKNIAISNCVIKRPEQNDYFDYKKYTIPGVTANYTNNSGIALEMVDGGTMEQIVINNITMFNTLTPIFIRYGQRHSPLVGTMKGIVISNITATSNSLMSFSITGIPDQYAENIKLSHIILNCPGGGRKEHTLRTIPEVENSYPENKIFGANLPAYGFFIRHVRHLTLEDIQFNLDNKDDRHALYLDDCRDITIDKVKTISHLSESAYIRTNNVENLMIRGFSTENALPSFLENSGKSSGIKLIGNDLSKVSQLYNEEIGQEVKEAGNLFENK